MWTSLSTNSLSRSSRSRFRSRPPRSRSPAMVFSNLFGARAPVLVSFRLEAQSALARGIRQRLDAAVIEIAAAVEHHFLDAILHRALRHKLACGLGGVDIGTGLVAHFLFHRRSRRQRLALLVVDHLRIDVLR